MHFNSRHILILAGTLFLLTCGRYRNDNPFDPDYRGSYSFSVDFSSLPDTLFANMVYSLPYTASGGNDWFSDIYVYTNPPYKIDYNFTDSLLEKDGYMTDGRLAQSGFLRIHFDVVFKGMVYARATSPNGKTVIVDSADVNVTGVIICGQSPVVTFTDDTIEVESGIADRIYASSVSGAIARYVFWFGDEAAETTAVNYSQHTFEGTAAIEGHVFAIDSCGNAGTVDSAVIIPGEYSYHLDIIEFPETVFVAREVRWIVGVNEAGFAGEGGKLYWSIDSAGIGRMDSAVSPDTLIMTVADSMALSISVAGRDAAGKDSRVYTRQVLTRTHRPVVAFTAADYECLINTSISCTISVTDPAGDLTVDSLYWKLDGGSFSSTAPSAVIWTHTFTDPRRHTLSVYAKDEEGFAGETTSVDIVVRSEIPVVSGLKDMGTVYPGQNVTLEMKTTTATTGGVITAYYWNFDGDTATWDTTTTANSLAHSFGSAGSHTVWLKVKDEFDKYSLADTAIVAVLSGAPELGGITLNVASTALYVADERHYGFSVTDPYGKINKLYFDVNGINVEQYNVSSLDLSTLDTAFYYAFNKDSSGSAVIRIRAEDDDGQFDTATLDVNVRTGTPVMDSLTYAFPDSLFINDTRTFTIYGHDTNSSGGFTFYYDMDNDDNWDGNTANGQFDYAFPVDAYGARTVRLGIMDEDSVVDTAEKVVNVRLGAPVVWGDTGDTLWVVINKGYVDYYYHPHYADTNGTADTFYFRQNETFSSSAATEADSGLLAVDDGNINSGVTRYAWVRDDDGVLTGPQHFIVFADSAPPKPGIVAAGGSGSPVIIAWSGKDTKDGNNTQYQILLLKGTQEPGLSDSLFEFSSGSTFDAGTAYSKDFQYEFTPQQGNGEYHYKVVSKDARGTKSTSNDGTFFY